ncbi:MAG: adenylosuccinate lyase [Defluviitaleaceae bacterium]|nr:adenylosuccinate lyase [Defluviitaleaceae bacterium]MCL2239299.1 adenylosuccinate lyase [Defluviitaleaceae bacterium]
MASVYENPLCKRYASRDMGFIFSDDNKFATWRGLWIALAESQRELGLGISDAQIDEMKRHATDINYDVAAVFERETRHDVMAHIKAYGAQCPQAAPIIHLGATSCYVGDNTDILLQRGALRLVKKLLVNVVAQLAGFAEAYKDLPCLAYTHFQAAQPTTVGKRATLWIQDLLFDLENVDFALSRLKLLGCKGTTGTGASFLALFDGDHEKVKQLEEKIAAKMGFDGVYPITGQTYSRKMDYFALSALSGIAQSAYKFSNDIRLLAHLKEIDEPFETGQVGSSAMAYKRNPMRSERIASLARYVMVDALNPALTASAQWLERTLDDSANRRISIPEAFLATDAILSLMCNIAGGMSVYPKIVEKHLVEELPFMATENILMHCVKKGGDRQKLHERIRVHALEAANRIKLHGGENDLLTRIVNDAEMNVTAEELGHIMDAGAFTGRAARQVEEFLTCVKNILNDNRGLLGLEVDISC